MPTTAKSKRENKNKKFVFINIIDIITRCLKKSNHEVL